MKLKTLILLLAAIATTSSTIASAGQHKAISFKPTTSPNQITSNSVAPLLKTFSVTNSSGSAEIALAKHLKRTRAKMYGAFWCPVCVRQMETFGRPDFAQINYIECDPRGQNPRRELCTRAGVTAYPTWEINGRMYRGGFSLNNLADISGYRGSRNFKTR